jgi:hypothetical protein
MEKLESGYGWTKGRKLTNRDVEYSIHDARIAWKYMDSQADLYEKIGAQMKSTTPATALDYYRRKFLREPLSELTSAALGFFRDGYYGGRVEIFKVGVCKGRIFYLDINSLYPFAMLSAYPNVNDISEHGRYGMVSATVHVPEMYIPPLPVRSGGKLVFPTGEFRGTWCTCELNYAKKIGVRVLAEHKRLGTNSLVYPFRGFVNQCYNSRLSSETALERTMWKFLMNGLYGKFGTSNLAAQRLVDPETVPMENRTGREYYVGDLLCVEDAGEPPPYANVLWSAWTTALARIMLHRALTHAERAGAVLYCDTDSIIVKSKSSPFPVGKALGEWKIEARIREFEARRPKLYRYVTKDGKTVKAKGVPSDYAEQFFNGMTARFKKPLRLREAARRGLTPNVWIDAEKSLQSGYDKRTILANGETRPLSFP